MPRAFVIRPMKTKKDSEGKEIDFEKIHDELIAPALVATGFGTETTTGEIFESGNIRKDVVQGVAEADLVVCDITIHNPNVYYELGIRHGLRKRRTVLIRGKPSGDDKPFDIAPERYVGYQVSDPKEARERLKKTIKDTLASDELTDSPVFQFFPNLAETVLSAGHAAPDDFREEVRRARAAEARGWLRLLSDEVRGRRYEWEGLRIVGDAQRSLRDYEGARESWEAIRKTYPRDIAANAALALIYGALYRDSSELKHREDSEVAIDRVKNNGAATERDLARVLTVRADNESIGWRRELNRARDVKERREEAINRRLADAYRIYHEAFLLDPLHVEGALGALKMGEILLHLSAEEIWEDAIDEPDSFKRRLEREVPVLRGLVPDLLKGAEERAAAEESARGSSADASARARIGQAEVLFLTATADRRVVLAYKDAISRRVPAEHLHLASRDLELYASLGIKADLVGQVTTAIREHVLAQPRVSNLVLFAGVVARAGWPTDHEKWVRQGIEEHLTTLKDKKQGFLGFAPASPGADILFHEVCADLGLSSTICLPMHVEQYAREVFADLDDWRRRFRVLIDEKQRCVLELTERPGLPRWLHDADYDLWERGRRWLVRMAEVHEAERRTLLTYWDGDEGPIAKLARQTSRIRIENLPPKIRD